MIPIFKTEASVSKSILTVEDTDVIKENYPVSIFGILKKYDIKELIVCDDNFINFPQLYKGCNKRNINFIFGCNFNICNDEKEKTEESLSSNCKVSVLIKNSQGYKDLLKLHNAINGNADGFYYTTRGSWKIIQDYWTENLELVLPSYDNFLHKNLLENGNAVPDFGKIKPTILYSWQDVAFDMVLSPKLQQFAANNNFEFQECHNIYYYLDSHFKYFNIARCINERTKFDCPNIDFLSSSGFSFESYLRKIGRNI